MTPSICPVCGKSALKKEVTDEAFEYKGKTVTVPHYIANKCDECREAIVDRTTLKTSGKILKDFKHRMEN